MKPHDLSTVDGRAGLIYQLLRASDPRLAKMVEVVVIPRNKQGLHVTELASVMIYAELLVRWVLGDAAGEPETMTEAHLVNKFLSIPLTREPRHDDTDHP